VPPPSIKQIVCLGERYKAAAASYALHETRLMHLLKHPHVVELRDFYPKSSNYFIIMVRARLPAAPDYCSIASYFVQFCS